mmetsp:Transcript_3916/g.9021  ORF Transcript_3916/g.9021 Transcript_3916/m.9021 type:complete len:236 (+) Transcript_3916:2193-2900(+)
MVEREEIPELLHPLPQVLAHGQDLLIGVLPQKHGPLLLRGVLQGAHGVRDAPQAEFRQLQVLLKLRPKLPCMRLALGRPREPLVVADVDLAILDEIAQMIEHARLPLQLLLAVLLPRRLPSVRQPHDVRRGVVAPQAAQTEAIPGRILECEPGLRPGAGRLVDFQAQQADGEVQHLCRWRHLQRLATPGLRRVALKGGLPGRRGRVGALGDATVGAVIGAVALLGRRQWIPARLM